MSAPTNTVVTGPNISISGVITYSWSAIGALSYTVNLYQLTSTSTSVVQSVTGSTNTSATFSPAVIGAAYMFTVVAYSGSGATGAVATQVQSVTNFYVTTVVGGPQGVQGNPGGQGLQGPQGVQGLQGLQGLQGVVAINNYTASNQILTTQSGTGSIYANPSLTFDGTNFRVGSTTLANSVFTGVTSVNTVGFDSIGNVSGMGTLACGAITSSGALALGTNTVACGAITSSGALALGANTVTCGAITSSGALALGANTVACGAITSSGALALGTNTIACGAITSSGALALGANTIACGAITSSGALALGANSASCGYVAVSSGSAAGYLPLTWANTTGGGAIGIASNAAQYAASSVANDTVIRSTSNKLLLVSGSGTNTTYAGGICVSNSNVGVNCNAPAYTLDISGTTKACNVIASKSAASFVTPVSAVTLVNGQPGAGGAQIELQYYSGGGYTHYIATRHDATAGATNGNAIDIWINASATGAYNASTAAGTGNSNSMSITALGVGVFCNAPLYKLDVNGTGKVGGITFSSGSIGSVTAINSITLSGCNVSTVGTLGCGAITSSGALALGTNTIACGAITSSGALALGTNTIACGAITSSGALALGANTIACGAITSSGALALGANTIACGAITSSGALALGTNTVTCGAITSSGSLTYGGTVTSSSSTTVSNTVQYQYGGKTGTYAAGGIAIAGGYLYTIVSSAAVQITQNPISNLTTSVTYSTGVANINGVAADANQNVFVSTSTSSVKKIAFGSGGTLSATWGTLPSANIGASICIDTSSNVYVGTTTGNIYKFTSSGGSSPVLYKALGAGSVTRLAIDPAGVIYALWGATTMYSIASVGATEVVVASGYTMYGIGTDNVAGHSYTLQSYPTNYMYGYGSTFPATGLSGSWANNCMAYEPTTNSMFIGTSTAGIIQVSLGTTVVPSLTSGKIVDFTAISSSANKQIDVTTSLNVYNGLTVGGAIKGGSLTIGTLAIDTLGNISNSSTVSYTVLGGSVQCAGPFSVTGSAGGAGIDMCNSGITNASYLNLQYGGSMFGSNTGILYVTNGTGGVQMAANGTAWTSASDSRMKTVLSNVSSATSNLSTITPVYYRFNEDIHETKRIGVIAQEVVRVFPELVNVPSDPTQMMSIDYSGFAAPLIAAVKELSARLSNVEAQLAART